MGYFKICLMRKSSTKCGIEPFLYVSYVLVDTVLAVNVIIFKTNLNILF